MSDIRISIFVSTFYGKDSDLNVWAYKVSMLAQDFGMDTWNAHKRVHLLSSIICKLTDERFALVNSIIYKRGSPLTCLNIYYTQNLFNKEKLIVSSNN